MWEIQFFTPNGHNNKPLSVEINNVKYLILFYLTENPEM